MIVDLREMASPVPHPTPYPHIANLDVNAFPTTFSIPVASRPASPWALTWSPSCWWYVGRVGMSVVEVFKHSVAAMKDGALIVRAPGDKEFHFQNWFAARLDEAGERYLPPKRNVYPDFRMVDEPVGYEFKGLETPGRWMDFDSNSSLPSGSHDDRTIYYAFGQYPVDTDKGSSTKGKKLPLVGLVICHGDFLGISDDYVHVNKHIPAFGTYGNVKIRDRKMYLAPTPWGMVTGMQTHPTLILPREHNPGKDFAQVGELVQRESDEIVVAYAFDLRTNELTTTTVPNRRAGIEHHFRAWRLKGMSTEQVAMRESTADQIGADDDDD